MGQTTEALYIQGTSACRIPSLEDNGWVLLDEVRKRPLTQEQRAVVSLELRDCGQKAKPKTLNSGWLIPASITIESKTFYWLDKRAAPMSQTIEVNEVDDSALAARRRPLDAADAVDVAQQQLENCIVLQQDGFIVCSKSGQSADDLHYAVTALKNHIAWLRAAFGFERPAQTIYVYLVPDIFSLQSLAAKSHGIELAYGTIGYAFERDLSVSAVVSGRKIGTLLHEITHLIVHNAYPNAPQWLEEGLASLYETSKMCGGITLGVPNWRAQILEQSWSKRVTLDAALRANWFQFSPSGYMAEGTRDAASYFSLIRQSLMRLQDQGDLGSLVRAMQSEDGRRLQVAQLLDGSSKITRLGAADRSVAAFRNGAGHLPAFEAEVRKSTGAVDSGMVPAWALARAASAKLTVCTDRQSQSVVSKALDQTD
ncbi:MAG: hypothetical protein BVN33_16535 [Proteobacteria bacterium ST_bin13]|nr:MAG: hypothetical protein BVN33_16535 [Proteobacteria bacterium ST_bin13]